MTGEDDDAAVLDSVLEALANPHRREIVYVLGLQPCAISQLARMRGLSLPAIHKHVKILENAGLVVKDAVVLIDREQGAHERLRHQGYNLLSIITLRAMLTYYVNTGRIGEDDFDRSMRYFEQYHHRL